MSTSSVLLVNIFAQLMRTDVVALWRDPAPGEKRGTYRPRHQEVTEQDIQDHVSGKQPIGLYVLPQDIGPSGFTRVAVVDLDDKTKQFSWLQLCHQAQKISIRLSQEGIISWPCRSGSGHGVHLWLRWKEIQDARLIREKLRKIVIETNTEAHVDIFPTADKLSEGELGSLVALPFGRHSRPILNLGTGEVAEDLSQWLYQEPPISAPSRHNLDVATLEKDAGKGGFDDAYGPVDIHVLKDALSYIPTDDYELWRDMGIALKQGCQNKQITEHDAELAWTEWASKDAKFDARSQDYNWKRFKPNGTLTIATIWYKAKECGWKFAAPVFRKPTAPISNGEPPRWKHEDAPEYMKRLNANHFFAIEGGKATVFIEDWDTTLQRHKLTRMSAMDFKLAYCDERVVVGHNAKGVPIVEELGAAWLKSEFRRKYPRGIVLQPEGCDDATYNLWRGWTVQALPEGSCAKFKHHVLENVCNGDKNAFEYVWKWCAYTVQKPHTPIGTAIVLRGDRGTGKSTFARVIGQLFGQHFMQVTSGRDLTGRFNAHLRDCILLFADEAVWAGSKTEESTLKGLITEPFISIEGKGRDLYQCRNMLHMIIATNHEWSVPAGLDERRFMALHCGDEKKQNTNYFSAIWNELENGGMSRLLHELLTLDISTFDPYNIPQTQELMKQKLMSLDPWAEWWFEKIDLGLPLETSMSWDEPLPIKALFYDYVAHCRLSGHRAPKSVEYLANRIRGMLPANPEVTRARLQHDIDFGFAKLPISSLQTLWKLPPLQSCRTFFDKKARSKISWENEPAVENAIKKPAEEMEIPF